MPRRTPLEQELTAITDRLVRAVVDIVKAQRLEDLTALTTEASGAAPKKKATRKRVARRRPVARKPQKTKRSAPPKKKTVVKAAKTAASPPPAPTVDVAPAAPLPKPEKRPAPPTKAAKKPRSLPAGFTPELLDSLRNKIVEVVAEGGDINIADVSLKVGVTIRRAENEMERLVAEGVLSKKSVGQGYVVYAATGRSPVQVTPTDIQLRSHRKPRSPKPTKPSPKTPGIHEAILGFIAENPGCDQRLISMKLGIPVSTLTNKIFELEAGQKIAPVDSGGYRVV